MPDKEIRFKPGRSYDVKLMIKDLDYSSELYKVRIVSTLNSPYQVILLSLLIDPQDLILEQVFGQEPLKLTVNLLKEQGTPFETTEFELMYLKSDFQMAMTAQNAKQIQRDRSPITILTVCRKAFKTLNTLVNDVIMEKTVKKAIEQLVNDNTEAELVYDSDGENTEQIDQIVIPPFNLVKAIKYLDNNFGLFDGILAIHCNYENKLFVKNLTKKMSKSQTFTVDHLTLGADQKEIIEKTTDGKSFYTYDNLTTGYKGNTAFSTTSKVINDIVKPKDLLYHTITHQLDEVCSKNGLIFQNDKMYFDSELSDNTKYNIDHTGYEKTETFAKARISKTIAGLSTLSFSIEKNLHILNLMNVGEVVKVNSGTVEFTDITGKYILKSSDITLNREMHWQAVCTLYLIRTNKTI